MTTWANILAEMRTELQDTGTPSKYSNDLLYIYTKDGLRDYSQWFPLLKVNQLLTVDMVVATKFAIPSDALDLAEVQCPLGKFLQARPVRPGDTLSVFSTPLFYTVDSLNVYLDMDPLPSGVFATYHAVHPIPASSADTTFALTIPDADLELIKLFVLGKVQVAARTKQSSLDRFKMTAGPRDDNPMIVEASDYMLRYHQGITQRMRGGTIQLFRPKRYVRSIRFGYR